MKTTFCRVMTADKLRLSGLLFESVAGTKTAVLHLHGRAGNFYASGFLETMPQVYCDAGFALLTVNLRGHDQIADFRVGDSPQILRIGQAFDTFEDCVLDISAWIDFLRGRGFEKIILQGHSQGSGKAIYYLNQKPAADIAALVLMSPAAARGLLQKYFADDFENNLAEAKNLMAQGRGDQLLSRIVRGYYVSAKSFLGEFGENSKADIFPIFRNGDFRELENVKIPVLAFYGSKEDTIINSPQKDLEIIKKHLVNPGSKTFVIEGAEHTYLGFYQQVSRLIVDWIKEIL